MQEAMLVSLGRSFVLPPFFPHEWLGGTFLGGSEASATPPPPNIDTHPRTYQHPYTPPCFSYGQALPTCPLLGGKGFLSLVSIPQLQQTMITKGMTEILHYL